MLKIIKSDNMFVDFIGERVSTETDGCVGCAYLISERRKTWNKYITLKAKYDEMVKVKRSKGIHTMYYFNPFCPNCWENLSYVSDFNATWAYRLCIKMK